jgi:hypothetical protein
MAKNPWSNKAETVIRALERRAMRRGGCPIERVVSRTIYEPSRLYWHVPALCARASSTADCLQAGLS